MRTQTQTNLRVLSIGSVPPAWGGPDYGGVATLHATLLLGLLDPACPVEPVAVVSPKPLVRPDRELPLPVLVRPPEEPTAHFYERLLAELQPDAVVMHHFAHTIGVTHARMGDPPPAIGIAHSWHGITFREGEQRARARATTEEALSGLEALVVMSEHCLQEGRDLGLRYPAAVETIYHPLHPFYAEDIGPARLDTERSGVACVGSLIPRKNPGALVEASASLNAPVVLAGQGELREGLLEQIAALALGDCVEIADLDDRQVRDLLLRSELMCLPSRSETFGIAYIEALACGAPVVGFGPTLREIRGEVGIEIGEPLETNAPEEIAAAIERVRGRDWDRGELRARTVEAFGLRPATRRYAELISTVARPSRQAPARPHAGAMSGDDAGRGSTAVCVLGSSRSGTSLTARLLSLAGVYLGADEELLGGDLRQLPEADRTKAKAANPAGFWEHYRLMRLNERILRSLGGNWREPPHPAPGWELSDELAAEREEARALLEECFAGHGLWGWKDPRTSLTLPFWQHLLPGLRYVVCMRRPLDVAASLEQRDGISIEDGLALWRAYSAAALAGTAGRPRLVVSYEDFFSDPAGTASGLARFVGNEAIFEGESGERLLAEAIDERLWRNRNGH